MPQTVVIIFFQTTQRRHQEVRPNDEGRGVLPRRGRVPEVQVKVDPG